MISRAGTSTRTIVLYSIVLPFTGTLIQHGHVFDSLSALVTCTDGLLQNRKTERAGCRIIFSRAAVVNKGEWKRAWTLGTVSTVTAWQHQVLRCTCALHQSYILYN